MLWKGKNEPKIKGPIIMIKKKAAVENRRLDRENVDQKGIKSGG